MLVLDTGQLPKNFDSSQCIYTSNNEVFLDDDAAGLLNDNGGAFPNWNGPYAKVSQLTDPWGRRYWFDHDYHCDVPNPKPKGCENYSGPVQAIVSSGPAADADYLNDYESDDIVYVRCE